MKKVLLLLVLLLQATASFGAVSEDMSVYVRKDVFEVYMQNINANTERILEELKNQRQAITKLEQSMSVLSTRIDGLEARMSDLRNDIYLWLVILGIIVSLPMVQRILQTREQSRSSVTLEDVRRLIEENNQKLMQNLQA